MAETPAKNIEKQLQEYAEQRRNDAGAPVLHPATRRMLQAEVRSSLGTSDKLPVSSLQPPLWTRIWPRIALACVGCVVLALVIFANYPPVRNSREAMVIAKKTENEFQAASKPDRQLSPMPREDSGRSSTGGNEVPMKMAVTTTPLPTPGSASGNLFIAKGGAGAVSKADNSGRSVTAKSAGYSSGESLHANRSGSAVDANIAEYGSTEAVMTKDSGVRQAGWAANLKDQNQTDNQADIPDNNQKLGLNSTTQRLQFRNIVAVDNRRNSNTAPILDEFTVEQNGNDLKIVDRDGSVYSGFVVVAEQSATLATLNYASDAELTNRLSNSVIPAATAQAPSLNAAAPQVQSVQTATPNTEQNQNYSESPDNNYAFRAEGFNRKLNQRVVITGNMFQNSLGVSAANNTIVAQQFQQRNGQMLSNQYNNSTQVQNSNYINGKVILGDSKESTELNALSVDGSMRNP
jgi:hypothetical protein